MARDRSTYTFRHGVTPETMTIISSKCKMYAISADDGIQHQIGVVASFDPSESRTIETIRGIGFGDHVAELVPGVTEPMSLAVTRTAQYLSMIYQVFGYKGGIDGIVRSLRHHKWPFDIYQELVVSHLNDTTTSELNSNTIDSLDTNYSSGYKAIVTQYEGCWFQDYATSFAADTAMVQENVTILVTDIIAGGSNVSYTETSDLLFNASAKSAIVTSTVSSK